MATAAKTNWAFDGRYRRSSRRPCAATAGSGWRRVRRMARRSPVPLSNYAYDNAGNITNTFGYDDSGRIVKYNGGQFQYGINALGQRVSKTAPVAGDANADGTISQADHDLTVQVIGGLVVAPGNPDCTRDNRVDVLDLTCINNLIVNGLISAPAETRYFVYDQAGHLLGEYDNNGAAIQETVWLGDLPVAVITGGTVYYIFADHLTTPRLVTRTDGTAVWSWRSDAFGNGAPNEDVDGDGVRFTYNLRFPGQYFDAESGLHYNYFRTYDPMTGRYLEADPIGLDGGLNLYGYVGGNPVGYTDPSGLILPAVAACLANPACVAAVRAGIGGIIGGLSAAVGALSDPCFDGNLVSVIGAGAIVGGASSLIPGTGSLAGAAVRGGTAGFSGNTVGQFAANGGSNNFSFSQAATAGVVGATALASGNAAGLYSAVTAVRSGASATQAIATGVSEGSAISTSIGAIGSLGQSAAQQRNSDCSCKKP